MNPLDWYGADFLILYGALFVAAMVASFRIARWLRPEGMRARVTEPEELALLNGGKDRFGEVVVARLLQRGALKVEKHKLVRLTSSGGGPTEAEVLRIGDTFSWSAVRKVTDRAAYRLAEALQRRGLLLETGERLTLALYSALPFGLLFLFGLAKVMVGLSRDRPVGFLLFFMVMTAFAAAIRAIAVDRRTRAGKDVCRDARQMNERLSSSHTREETGMAVALFGTGILATTAFGDFHKMRASSSGDGGGSGSDGGGGGGGGGCGGCGS